MCDRLTERVLPRSKFLGTNNDRERGTGGELTLLVIRLSRKTVDSMTWLEMEWAGVEVGSVEEVKETAVVRGNEMSTQTMILSIAVVTASSFCVVGSCTRCEGNWTEVV